MSRRSDALGVLLSRLGGIEPPAFVTDVGGNVLVMEIPTFGDGDPDATLLVSVGDDEPGYQGENVSVTLPVDVFALVRAGANAWATVENIIADIKKAVETDHDLEKTLKPRGLERGRTRALPREEGSAFVGASVEYRLRYSEGWGQP